MRTIQISSAKTGSAHILFILRKKLKFLLQRCWEIMRSTEITWINFATIKNQKKKSEGIILRVLMALRRIFLKWGEGGGEVYLLPRSPPPAMGVLYSNKLWRSFRRSLIICLLLLCFCSCFAFAKRGVQKEGDLNEAVEQHQWCRLFFHKIGNLNGAFAPSFKYTDVVQKMF